MNPNRSKKSIPEGWNWIALVDVADIFSGGTPDTDDARFWGGEINWITPTEITKTGKYIYLETEKKITDLGLKNSSAKLLPKGALIVCTRATVGECSISTYPIATNQGFKNLVPKKDTTVDYLYYFIKSVKRELVRLGSGSTFLEISKGDIENLKLHLPPLPEQNRIVAVLETWDKAIEKLSKKIEGKKNVKKGLMQELLTGKTRLPGFTEKREVAPLAKAAQINPKTGSLPSAFIYIDLESVTEGELLTERYIELRNAPSRAQRLLRAGDVIFQMVRPYQMNNLYFNKVGDYVASTGYAQLRSHGDSRFLYYLLHTDRFVSDVLNRCTGSSYPAINSVDLGEIEIKIPKSQEEQSAIADILTTADQEIGALERKLKALKVQKRYLLNTLITGEIRTPETLVTYS